jgi:hypothetical protein
MKRAPRGRALCALAWFTVGLVLLVASCGAGAKQGATGDAAGAPDASKLPFVLEHHLHARRTARGGSVTLDDVVTGQSVLVNGDLLQLSIRTSQQGYLYLAFCSQHDTGPRYHGLSVFPPQGSIALTANVARTVPSRVGEIALDNNPGRETIFIVVSKTELSRSDSRLADILDGARQGAESADCGSFQRAVTGPNSKPVPVPTTTPLASKAARAGARAPSPVPAEAAAVRRPPPSATIERGVDIVLSRDLLGTDEDGARLVRGVDAGPDGIVVLRYEFLHVAP